MPHTLQRIYQSQCWQTDRPIFHTKYSSVLTIILVRYALLLWTACKWTQKGISSNNNKSRQECWHILASQKPLQWQHLAANRNEKTERWNKPITNSKADRFDSRASPPRRLQLQPGKLSQKVLRQQHLAAKQWVTSLFDLTFTEPIRWKLSTNFSPKSEVISQSLSLSRNFDLSPKFPLYKSLSKPGLSTYLHRSLVELWSKYGL